MIKLLSIILFILLCIICGKQGLKVFLSIYINLALVIILVYILAMGISPLIPTIIITLLITIITIFYLNRVNKKTICSFISVICILIFFFTFTIVIGNRIYIQGYSVESIESIGYISYNTGLNMLMLSNSVIIIGLIGNIIDTSMAISSALYEVYLNNKELTQKELFESGMNIGKDILGTTTNTLFFAYLGSCTPLFLYFQDFHMSFSNIINSKIFAIEFTRIIISGTASFLIIPLTSLITSISCKVSKEEIYEKISNYLRRQKPSSH